MGGLQHQLSGG